MGRRTEATQGWRDAFGLPEVQQFILKAFDTDRSSSQKRVFSRMGIHYNTEKFADLLIGHFSVVADLVTNGTFTKHSIACAINQTLRDAGHRAKAYATRQHFNGKDAKNFVLQGERAFDGGTADVVAATLALKEAGFDRESIIKLLG